MQSIIIILGYFRPRHGGIHREGYYFKTRVRINVDFHLYTIQNKISKVLKIIGIVKNKNTLYEIKLKTYLFKNKK